MEERLVQTTQHNHTKMSNVCFAQVYLEWDLLPQSSAVVGSMSESWVTKTSLRDMACVISIRSNGHGMELQIF